MNDAAARTFAWWLSAPAGFSAMAAIPIGLISGAGLVLVPILALTSAGIWFGGRAVWRRFGPANAFAGFGIGWLAGIAAGAVVYGAFALDARIGPSLGGSIVESMVSSGAAQGLNAGVAAAQPGGVANVAMAPALLVAAPAGAMAGALFAILAMLAVCGLCVVAGAIGGAVAARKSHP
jgi:hypothetical protein